MSISKYFGEQAAGHGDKLNWPGLFGVPVRGQVGALTEDEYDTYFDESRDFHWKEFDLTDDVQGKEYTEVMDRIVNGWYVQIFIDRPRDPTNGTRKVYLEWIQRYGQIRKPSDALAPIASAVKRVS